MKVLTKPPQFEPRRVKCQGSRESCGAELEIEFNDLKRVHHAGDWRDPAYDEVL